MGKENLTIPNLTGNSALDRGHANLSGNAIFESPELYSQLESNLKANDEVGIVQTNGELKRIPRADFLPKNGYLIHFNIAVSPESPHIEPLPAAHDTISTQRLCMIEGQKQYVLEMEAAVVGIIEDGKYVPQYIGTLADFGDRTPRIDGTGRAYKTWTPGVEFGGSTGASTVWVEVNSWEDVTAAEMEYWVYGADGEIMLHTPNAPVNSLKIWGARLGEWVANYPKAKLDQLGIVEGEPFLLSTGQILFSDDGARSINPEKDSKFTAKAVMRLDENRVIATNLEGHTVPKSETTFRPTEPPFSYYEK